MRRVRILVVDDHHMLREALVGMLEAAGFEVVGAVGDGADATSLAVELTPDVVLMDLSMPVLNGAIAYLPKGCGAERLRATVEAAVTLASGQLHRA